jgi:hypothetical protein
MHRRRASLFTLIKSSVSSTLKTSSLLFLPLNEVEGTSNDWDSRVRPMEAEPRLLSTRGSPARSVSDRELFFDLILLYNS